MQEDGKEGRRHAAGKPPSQSGSDKREDDAELVEKVEQQHSGAHQNSAKEKAGADRFGGTRAGAENVEPKKR